MLKRRSIALMLVALIFFGCFNWGTLFVMAADKEMSYTFAELEKVTEWGCSSEISGDGELKITFDGQYQSQFYEIPSEIDPSTIEKLVFDVTSGNAADLAFKMHTQADFDSDNKEGTPVSYGNPEVVATGDDVIYLSIMSLNAGTTEASISGVTFYLSGEGTPREDKSDADVPLLDGDNVINNGNFEDSDTSMWTVDAGSATITCGVSDSPIAGDITSYGIISNRDRAYDCFSQDVTDVVELGHTYAFEFYAMLSDEYEGAPGDQRQIDFAPYIVSGSDTTYLGSYSAELSGTVSAQLKPGEWTRFNGTFKVTAAGSLDKVVIRLLEQGTNYGEGDCVKGEYYVTAVSLVDMNIASATIEKNVPNLKDTFVADFGDDMIAGVSITGSEIADPQLMELVTKHFNGVTLGNELKPDSMFGYSNGVCPGTEMVELNGEMIEVPVVDFSRAEKLLDYIYDWNQENPDNIIKVRGHVLVWHSQTPEWFFHEDYDKTKPYVTPEVMNKRLEWYIKTVLTHFTGEDSKYNGMFYGWDVVNEAVSDGSGTYRSENENSSEPLSNDTHGSNSSWWAVYQSNEFIINAFRYANMYAPADVELYYNDYNDSTPSKVGPIIELLKAVKNAEGTRIDGMGMQAHYDISSPGVDQFLDAARQYAAVVGEIQLTEFDIKASMYFDGTDATKDDEYTRQAHRYKELYEAMKQLKSEGINVGGMTVWGVIDGNSWLQSNAGVGGGADGTQTQCPLLFDDDYHVKPCFWAIVDPTQLTPLTQKVEVFKSVTGDFDGAAKNVIIYDDVTVEFAPIWTDNSFKVQVTVMDATDDGASDNVTLYFDKHNSKSNGINPGIVTVPRTEGVAIDGGYQVVLDKELDGTETVVGFDIVVCDNETLLAYNDTTMNQATSTKHYAEAYLKQSMYIAKGTAVVDGEIDDAYANATDIELGIVQGAKATATAKVLWDENYLYVYTKVVDPQLNADNEAVHEQDSFEIFVDETNSKASSYNAGTKQYRINYENALSFNGEKCVEENITSVAKTTDDGYIIEAAIKWTEITPSDNTTIGIELQVNDADMSAMRIGTLNWYDTTNDCWENPACYGTATLVNEIPTAPEIEDAVSGNGEAKSSGATAAIAAVAALAVCGGGAYVLKKKKDSEVSDDQSESEDETMDEAEETEETEETEEFEDSEDSEDK